MTADQFIDLLEDEAILEDPLLAKLRKKVAGSGGNMSAKKLARFLVRKGHISEFVAVRLLDEPLDDDFDQFTDRGDTARDQPSHSEETATGREQDESDELVLTPIAEVDTSDRDNSDTQTRSAERQAPPAVDVVVPPENSSTRLAGEELFDELSGHRARPDAARVSDHTHADRLRRKKKKKKKAARRKNDWDSPLLLMGGGSLILLILCGVTVWYLLFRETGDEQFALAQEAKNQGSYSQAISHYEAFLEKFPGHAQESTAKVELAMVRLRRATEGRSDFEQAMRVATDQIEAVEQEESFDAAREEMAALLPTIARGLAEQADAEADRDKRQELVELAVEALNYCASNKYIPSAMRDDAQLLEIREILARVQRRQQAYDTLQLAVRDMQQAVAAGDTRQAYEVHRQFVKAHPGLAAEPELLQTVGQTSTAEQSGIEFVKDERPALAGDLDTPIVASLALARQRGGEPASATGTVYVHVEGALYGLDASTGRLLWRRFTGFDEQAFVERVEGGVLVRDARRQELQLREAATGELLWRQPLAEPFAPPLVLDDRIFVATDSGRLFVLDVASGTRIGYLQFAQPLRMTPATDALEKRLYVVGEHSSLYTISLSDLSCLHVFYLGHSVGSIQVPPVVVLNKLAVAVNQGVESARLHLLSLDGNGTVTAGVVEDRLTGLVVTPLLVEGRRMVVLTDRGQINTYEIGPQTDRSALSTLVSRPASSSRAVMRYALLTDNSIWLADEQLTKYVVQPTGNRLLARNIDQDYGGSTFNYPLQQIGTTIVHLRRPERRQGVAVAAMDISSGQARWETDLSVPPAGPPLIDSGSLSIVSANSNGDLFVLDRQAILSRVQDQPVIARGAPPQPPRLTHMAALGKGRAVCSAVGESPWVLLYGDEAERRGANWIKLPSPLAAPPARLGDGILMPLSVGQVFYLDSATGEPMAVPFQPRLQVRTTVPWNPIGTAEELGNTFILSDGRDQIYLVAIQHGTQPALVADAEAKIPTAALRTRIAIANRKALAGNEQGKLAVFEIPEMRLIEEVSLPGQVVWGPYAVGAHVLLATETEELICVDSVGKIVWQHPLSHGEIAGLPHADDQSVLLAFERGVLQRIDLNSGEAIGEHLIDQPLKFGPVPFQNRYLLAAHDGTLLVVEQP